MSDRETADEIAETIADFANWWCTECGNLAANCSCEINVRDRARRIMSNILTGVLSEATAAGRQQAEAEIAELKARLAEAECVIAFNNLDATSERLINKTPMLAERYEIDKLEAEAIKRHRARLASSQEKP